MNYCQKVSDTSGCCLPSQVHTLSCSYTHPLFREVLLMFLYDVSAPDAFTISLSPDRHY